MTAWHDRRFQLGCMAFLLHLAAVFCPPLTIRAPVYDVIVVMDITGSMNVPDQVIDGNAASRLQMEKRAAGQLLSSLPCSSRLGLGIFVETRPFLLFEPIEVCGNAAPLRQEIEAIDWRMAWDGESHIAIGLHNAMQTAKDVGADLIFMTDGQEVPPVWWTGMPDFTDVRNSVHGVLAGVGALTFSAIPKFDFSGRQIGTWKPGDVPTEHSGEFHGREHLSALDEGHLQSLAKQSGLSYLRLSDGGLMPALKGAVPRREHPAPLDLRAIPAALALILLLCAAAESGDVQAVRRAGYRAFSSARIARRPSRKLG